MKLNLLLFSLLLLPLTFLAACAADSGNMSHEINIELFPASNKLVATDKITTTGNQKVVELTFLNELQIEKITNAEGKNIDFKIEKSENYSELIITPSSARNFTIYYAGTVYHKPGERSLKETHAHSRGMISDKDGEGIYLPAGAFYPYNNDLCNYSVNVIFPENLEVITSGKVISETTSGNKKTKIFTSELPTDNITLVGGKYFNAEREHKGVKFRMYTFEESRNSEAYLQAMTEYYDLYTELFGEYPYSSFDIVENFFATGFGMPNYTLITGMLMKMPWVFLAPGSLAHEFVHNWWGNSIYIAEGEGNWCEALTTFSSNYYYNVKTGNVQKALEWRKKALIDLETLPEENNYPLKEFVTQRHTDDAAVGYSKGAFVFYELFKLFGEKDFFSAIKQFAKEYKGKRASWTDIKNVFSKAADKSNLNADIEHVFSQWLNLKERPTLKLNVKNASGGKLDFTILQDLEFEMKIPIVISTDKGEIIKDVLIKDKENKFSFEVGGNILKVRIDPDYQVLRHLNKFEIPYTFASTLNKNPLVILPKEDSKTYKVSAEFVGMLDQSGYKCDYTTVDKVNKDEWKNRPILVLGSQKDNSFFAEFKNKYPKEFTLENNILKTNKEISLEGNLLLINMTHPGNKDLPATIVAFDNLKSSDQLKRLFHYMSYSMLMISQTKRGRPLYSQEIFPEAPANNDLNYVK